MLKCGVSPLVTEKFLSLGLILTVEVVSFPQTNSHELISDKSFSFNQ